MTSNFHKAFAAVLLTGAVALAGPSFAAAAGTAVGPSAPASGTPSAVPDATSIPAPATDPAGIATPQAGHAGDAATGKLGGNAETGIKAPGGTVDAAGTLGADNNVNATPAGQTGAAQTGPKAQDEANGAGNSPESSTSGVAANESGGTEAIGAGLGKTATPAKGLSKTAKARVNRNEMKITSELNRQSASSTGNANPSNQASTNPGGEGAIQTP
jgi:hypothetical protein